MTPDEQAAVKKIAADLNTLASGAPSAPSEPIPAPPAPPVAPASEPPPPPPPPKPPINWDAIGAAQLKYNSATGKWWNGSYDALLAWATGPTVAPVPPPAPPMPPAISMPTPAPTPASSPASAASIAAKLGLGLNIERTTAFRVSLPDLAYYRDLGITHLRTFVPWNGANDFGLGTGLPSAGQMQPWIDFTKHAQSFGMVVLLDCTDVLDVAQAGQVEAHLANCLPLLKQLDPAMTIIGAVNEHAGSDNATWNPWRAKWLAQLRAGLPNHVLSTGPAYWKDFQHLWDDSMGFELPADPNVVLDCHHYVAWDWTWTAGHMAAWQAAHGNPVVIFGESGSGWGNNGGGDEYQPAHWVTNLPGQAALKPLHPTLWSVTDGGWWRLNNTGDYRLLPALEPVVKALAAACRP